MKKLVMGYLPTRRFVFSKEDARKYKKAIYDKISNYDIEIVDIEDLDDEGLLYDSLELAHKIIEKYKAKKVDCIFVPHCNFGTEDTIAKVCKEIGKPVLIWGPRDEAPLPNGARLRDTQCGVFVTGKVLRRYNIKFTYLQNCHLTDNAFDIGFDNFIRTANVVKAFKNIRILQIGSRPAPFMSMICNEGELLEKFNIEIIPINLKDIEIEMFRILKEEINDIQVEANSLENKVVIESQMKKHVDKVIALKKAISVFAKKYMCDVVTIQCWSTLQKSIGIMPCLSNALLADEGLPVMCESDIHGAITTVIAKAATMDQKIPFLADLTVRHPDNDNGELLFHCGNFSPSLSKEGTKMKFGTHAEFEEHLPGTCEGEIKSGELSILRFDGDKGEYSFFMGKAKTIKGPMTWGSYVWIEVNDWPLWEETLVTGPYVHHVVGIYGNHITPIYEAMKYIDGIKMDLLDPSEEELKKIIRNNERGVQ